MLNFIKNNLQEKIKKIPIAWLLVLPLSIFGVVDTIYLVIKHYGNQAVFCVVGAIDSCNTVLSSVYSTIFFGIHLSVIGLFYYSLVLVLILLFIVSKKYLFYLMLLAATTMGFLFSMWLVYLQVIVLGNICLYCMLSAFTSTLLFVVNLLFIVFNKDLRKDKLQIL